MAPENTVRIVGDNSSEGTVPVGHIKEVWDFRFSRRWRFKLRSSGLRRRAVLR